MADLSAELECYILDDQPTTCGICGARTTLPEEGDGTQIHQCLSRYCGY
jgi:hypothetical protein